MDRSFIKPIICLLLAAIVFVACGETAKENIPVTSISLEPTTLSLVVGEVERISVKITPENADGREVTWESTDNNVATVSSGLVTAISEGATTIRATAGGKSASCSVTVTPKTIAVSSVSLNKTTLALAKGEKEILIATISPDNASDKAITWSSSNEAVATVSPAGEVSAVSAGTATITATVGGISATCQLTVNVPLKSISFVDGVGMIVDDMEVHKVSVVLNPEDATASDLSWKIEDESILAFASEEGSLVRYVKAVNNGTTTITVSSAANSISESIPLEVKVKVTRATIGKGTWNETTQDWDWEGIYNDYYGTFGEVITPVVYIEPEIAYYEDGEFIISDENIATFDNDENIVLNHTDGRTLLTLTFPYSSYTTQVMIHSKEYLSNAGIRNIQQRNETNISFGGRIYTNVPTDQLIVNSINLCDNQGFVISSTVFQPEPLTMYGSGTNYIRFWTPYINMTQKYGIYTIDQAEFDPFISQWYFYITYQTKVGELAKHAKLYIEPQNWNADY